jgi:hypothetical protein
LIDSIEVNLEKLENVWDILRVSDLGIDLNKFEVLEDMEAVVVSANKPKEEKIEEETPIVAEWATEATATENKEEGKE